MKYLEITIITTTAASELAAELLTAEGSSGISIVDKNDLLALSKEKAAWDYIEDGLLEKMGEHARVSGYFDLEAGAEAILRLEKRAARLNGHELGIDLGPMEIVKREIDDNDWIDLWKKHFVPVNIGGITIVPEWLAGGAATDGAQKNVFLNPGMAFGTGEHETTRGCIELLQRAGIAGKTVIDLGCGSGILGLTAAALGAARVTMIDIDALAVKAARHNVLINAENGLDVSFITVTEGDLFQKADMRADVIAANLASGLLISAAKDITAHLNPGGALILSGIIEERLEGVLKAYRDVLGADAVKETLHLGDWVALLLLKGE